MATNKLKEITLRKHRCTVVADSSIHKLTPRQYKGNEWQKQKKDIASSLITHGIWL